MATKPAISRLDGYLALCEAGAFDDICGTVELLGGKVVMSVNAGRWHGIVQMNVVAALMSLLDGAGYRGEIAPTAPMSNDDAPDPDLCWVRRDAQPVPGYEGRAIVPYYPHDYGLIVEIANTSFRRDTLEKVLIYARGGMRHYWVVHPAGVIAFSEPDNDGYRVRRDYATGERVPVPHTAADVEVDALLDVPDWVAPDQ